MLKKRLCPSWEHSQASENLLFITSSKTACATPTLDSTAMDKRANTVLSTKADVIAAYPDVFNNALGPFMEKEHLEIKKSVTQMKRPLW